MTQDPRKPGEWQEAVNAAAVMRMIADCKMYGLIDGGPEINVERCDWILDEGRKLGYVPSVNVAEAAANYAASYGREESR